MYEESGSARRAIEAGDIAMKTGNNNHTAKSTLIERHLCVPEDQVQYLPKRRRAPVYLPADVPLPRQGEIVYLSSSSAWVVLSVIHEWRSHEHLRVEIWIEHVSGSRHARPPGFALTQ